MPISVQVTRGLLTPQGEREIVPRIGRALLQVHGLADNEFMQENVVGTVQVTEQSATYVGGKRQSLAVVELKVPSVTFRDRAMQQTFIDSVTGLIDELKAGDHPKSRTFVHVVHALDGAWGIGGHAYTNDELGRAIAGARTLVQRM
jgi:phenylpyruvate tautomerase PptA (4-oxalocrotonate tautomerase family)